MTETLGYPKYAASGTDYGSLVTAQLGHKYADSLYGVHFGLDLRPDIEAPAGFTFLAGDHYPPGADVRSRVEVFEGGPTRSSFNSV